MSTAQHPVQDLDWLVTDFAERVRHVAHAVVVSADGFARAFSAGLPRCRADQLAAVTSGLAGLADGAARTFEAGEVIQTAVEMEAGLLVTMPAGNGSTLAVLAATECDLGLISCEMSVLAERAGREPALAIGQRDDPGSPLPAVPLQAGSGKPVTRLVTNAPGSTSPSARWCPEPTMLTALSAAHLRPRAVDRARQVREPACASSTQLAVPYPGLVRGSGGARPRAASFSVASSQSSCGEAMRSMFRDPRGEDHTI